MFKKFLFTFIFLLNFAHCQFNPPIDISSLSFITGGTASNPQISIISSGKGICVWQINNGTNTIIQSARTDNFGVSFYQPIDLTLTGLNAQNPQVTLASNGKGACVWNRSNGVKTVIQASFTNDYGATFQTAQNLSDGAQNAITPQIAIDDATGKGVCVWNRSNGVKTVIQAAYTDDWGASFQTPRIYQRAHKTQQFLK